MSECLLAGHFAADFLENHSQYEPMILNFELAVAVQLFGDITDALRAQTMAVFTASDCALSHISLTRTVI